MADSDVDAFLAGYQGPVEEVPICGRPDLIAEHARIESELAGHRATGSLGGRPAELVEQLEALEAEIEATVLVFRLRGQSFSTWVELQGQHPPTPQEVEQHRAVHTDTFEPAALAACAFDPELTVEQATRMRETIAATEWAVLMGAVYRLHREQSTAPKSLLLSVLRPASDASPGTPPSEESPEAGSLAGNGEQ